MARPPRGARAKGDRAVALDKKGHCYKALAYDQRGHGADRKLRVAYISYGKAQD